jgi:diguanylate cyclase (GGDEF)-like protein
MLDVDYFKRYNDFYGHPAGDAALKSIADVLRASAVRAVDLCARVGGEEFVLLLPDTGMEGAMEMAARVRDELARRALPHARSDVSVHVTASMGVAVARDESVEDFIRRADQALYLAKQAGRDRAASAD